MSTRTRLLTTSWMLLLAVSAAASDWRSKVDPWVLDSGRAPGGTEFLVFLADQPDLGRAATLGSREERGRWVYETLSAAAARSQAPILAELERLGIEHRSYWIANMIWVRGGLDVVQTMAEREDVARVAANPAVPLDPAMLGGDDGSKSDQRAVEWNISLVGAPEVWALGITGEGVVVAGQDTGYLWSHPALVNQYRGGPAGVHDYNWHDAIHSGGGSCGADSVVPCDDHGHGTHTMGTIVGDDGGSNQIGMAPAAMWIGCRNMNVGVGTPATYAECYQWFIAPTDLAGENPDPSKAPHVINNSWGCPPSEGCTSPEVLLTVVQNVRAAGIVTVHSAGNDGSGCSTVSDPAAIYEESFSVGATDSGDDIAYFSSRGPVTVDGSNRMKPNISAPGVSIRSSTRDGGYEGGWSGTSMAGPHVAGLVALLLSGKPGLAGNVDLVEDIIEQTAVPLTTTQGCGGDLADAVPNNVFGWGRIDAEAALAYPLDFTLEAQPAAVSACAPVDAQVTVGVGQFQGFDEPVTLATDGLPAGAGASFSVNPVTPPGSSALTVSGTGAVAPGVHAFEVVGVSASSAIERRATVELMVADQVPATPSPVSPAGGATGVSLKPAFSWTTSEAVAVFALQVATDGDFSNLVVDEAGIEGTSYTLDSDLLSNTRYFWRVRGLNPCGISAFSPAAEFFTQALAGDCGIGTTVAVAFEESFESGAVGWTHSGTGDTWALSSGNVHGGSLAFHGDDVSVVSDQLLVSPSIALPPIGSPLTLQFWNHQDLEDSGSGCYDGGILEISTDDGVSWAQLGGSLMSTDPYDGPVSTSFSNPLSGLQAWCGNPQDWTRAVVELGGYAGQTVRFRFRLGTDSGVGYTGWTIDDVKVQACVPGSVPLFADDFESGETGAWAVVVP